MDEGGDLNRRPALALIAALVLGGCAGHAEGLMQPPETVARCAAPAHCVDMVVVTNRLRDPDPRRLYSGERGPNREISAIEVSVPPDGARKVGEINWPSTAPGNPATDFVTTHVEPNLSVVAARNHFNAVARAHSGRVLLFVHGYNTKFEDAVYRFAQFAADTGNRAAPVLFTWPSRGDLFAYPYDRESANYSRDTLEEGLHQLQASPDVREITLVAHSMGNWIAVEALRQMAIRDRKLIPKLKNIVLAAPDLDVDVFRKQYADIPAPRPTVTVLISRDDRALAVSAKVWGAGSRLGALGAEAKDADTVAELKKEGINAIDITDLTASDPSRHARFATAPEMVQMIGVGMVEGDKSMGTGQASLGQRVGTAATGIVGAIGGAAGAAVTAPIAIVDPGARETFSGQVQSVGGSLSGAVTGTP